MTLTARLSRRAAAAVGVLAVWAALGAGHLAAGLISSASSPLPAVGDAVIRLSPQPLTEFATTTFGTNDKLVLLTGVFVLVTLAGAMAGLLSRARPESWPRWVGWPRRRSGSRRRTPSSTWWRR